MARIAPLHSLSLKRPPRASLRHIGIPDGRDVLAVYLWWAKQQRYRAFLDMSSSVEVASSVRSVIGMDEEREPPSPAATTTSFGGAWAGFDCLRGVGGQFD